MAAIERSMTQLKDDKVRDASGSARNAAVGKAVNIDKILQLEQRPTSIVQHRSGDEVLRQLERMGRASGFIVEGSAEDVPMLEGSTGEGA